MAQPTYISSETFPIVADGGGSFSITVPAGATHAVVHRGRRDATDPVVVGTCAIDPAGAPPSVPGVEIVQNENVFNGCKLTTWLVSGLTVGAGTLTLTSTGSRGGVVISYYSGVNALTPTGGGVFVQSGTNVTSADLTVTSCTADDLVVAALAIIDQPTTADITSNGGQTGVATVSSGGGSVDIEMDVDHKSGTGSVAVGWTIDEAVMTAATAFRLRGVTGSATVDVAESSTIAQGATLNLTVTVTRTAPFTGDLTITATGLPSGVTAAPLTILAGSTTGTLVLTATGGATLVTDDPWQVVAAGSGIANATDDVTLTVTAAPFGGPPVMSEGAVLFVQPVSPAAPESVPFVAISATTGADLTSAAGITIRYKKPGGAWTDKTAAYDGEAGCFVWTPLAGDVDTLGRARFVIGGVAGRVSYNMEIVGADQRQSFFRATWASLDSVGWSPLKYLRSVFSTSASFLSGAQTGTGQFRNPTDTTTWTQASWDGNGNRSAITFSAPNDP
jgi:hypothetical protein